MVLGERSEPAVGMIGLGAYSASVAETDVLPKNDDAPLLMGLYGEVGGIMATTKKLRREQRAFPGYTAAAKEEFGDTLWYLAAYCRRRAISLESVFDVATRHVPSMSMGAGSDVPDGALVHVATPEHMSAIDQALFRLGRAASSLLEASEDPVVTRSRLEAFAVDYLAALHAVGFGFDEIARSNIEKSRGAFLEPDLALLPRFDNECEEEERIPTAFRIRINQRRSGRSYLQWNGVFIGDPLTDNSNDPDGYRFHDVFHLAHAAILHWSPVFRALIKQKRKSRARDDEVEDGGRAIVVEEGLTAWIFSRAKALDYFNGHDRISLDILKTIQEFTGGYEVSCCPLKLWERALLQGYAVFRQLRDSGGGWIAGDRESRSIRFEPL